MRDGKTVLYKPTSETNYDEIVKSMVGRDLTEQFPERTVNPGETLMHVKSLNNDEQGIKDISFSLRKGEILGFSGLMGAG
ncbi:D-xylose ABC transporter ATP-binding protein, partial [Mammaliicoccus sciuri]|nr:D-xylose ABC transporter ATP-binding protein [Mammaliicoccus sciuri]